MPPCGEVSRCLSLKTMKFSTHQKLAICLTLLLQCLIPLALAQTCDVGFPGTGTIHYSAACGRPSSLNLRLGKNIGMADGDVFVFDSPAMITISENFLVDAEGSGKIIVPSGVTVVINGNFQVDRRNSGCSHANPCAFEIEVNGTIHVSQNLQNNLVNLIWSGTGSVVVDHHFENASKACMTCNAGGCPGFQISSSDCTDKGSDCSGQDFCARIAPCSADQIPPVITNCPVDLIAYSTADCSQIISWTPPSVSDNCNLASFEATHSPGTTFSTGITTVTYTATDGNGNISTCSFNISVIDSIAPTMTGCPGDITSNADPSLCQAQVHWAAPIAIGKCDDPIINGTHKPGDIFPIGETQVKYVAKSKNGSSSVCKFKVIVKNQATPKIVNCPKNIFVKANTEGVAYAEWTPPAASGHCAEIVLIGSHQPGDVFNIGTTEIEYRATDNAGNDAYCRFHVVVSEPEIQIGISQLITPDGDGMNDAWTIAGIGKYKENEVTIVDRWGNLIFGAKGYDNENVLWKGANRNGHPVPSGTYFYAISVKHGSSKLERSGFIEVVNNK